MADRNRDAPDKTGNEPEEDFLSRWSRRKRDAARADEPPPAPEDTAPAAQEEPGDGPTDADLPPIESLGPDSDYSAYLSGRVSEHLRRAALRKLFRQPVFNIRDGLDDYDEDYRSFAALGETITADMRYHRERLREEAARSKETEPAGEDPTDAAPPDSEAVQAPQRTEETRTSNEAGAADDTTGEPAPGSGEEASDTDGEHE